MKTTARVMMCRHRLGNPGPNGLEYFADGVDSEYEIHADWRVSDSSFADERSCSIQPSQPSQHF